MNSSISTILSSIRDPRWRDILKRRLNKEKLDSIGITYGLTRERIRQIQARILHDLPQAEYDLAIELLKRNNTQRNKKYEAERLRVKRELKEALLESFD